LLLEGIPAFLEDAGNFAGNNFRGFPTQ